MYLSIDYGQKKLGLAISDETNLVASALPLIRVKDETSAIKKIVDVLNSHKVTDILIGMPSGWQNIDSPQTKVVRDFIILLKQNVNLPVHEWDESYSTKIAEKNISGKQKKNSDSYAAALILQEYLDYIRYEKNL